MFWADKFLENLEGDQVVNDSTTPSGMVHMGGLKGPVFHDVFYKILKQKKKEVIYRYGFDDADPIDGLPPELRESHNKYLGVPIYKAPSPDGNGTFGEYFSRSMLTLQKRLGIKAEIYRTSELYSSGFFDKAIRSVLDNAQGIRKVYEEIYKKPVASDWFPVQVICSKCGKIGTTKVTKWDGKEVYYECSPDLVTWATGCSLKEKISPFAGKSKMLWKVEWAAKWWCFGVTVEAAGKDHASAGGSYDVAMKICKDVFKHEPPRKLAYEFFLSGGKKMSSSKGVGLTGEELLETLSPEVARFLMIKTPPNQAVEFTPRGTNIIPQLFEEFQKFGSLYFEKKNDDFSRAFELSQVGSIKKVPDVRFSTLTQWVQMPNMQEEIKKQGLEEWVKYAHVWIEKYAPDTDRFLIQPTLPQEAKKLTLKQKEFLKLLLPILESNQDSKQLEVLLYEKIKELNLSTKEGFASVYITLLGKSSGPKAAALLQSLDKEFLKKRFTDATR